METENKLLINLIKDQSKKKRKFQKAYLPKVKIINSKNRQKKRKKMMRIMKNKKFQILKRQIMNNFKI